jgi:hypothetical protein
MSENPNGRPMDGEAPGAIIAAEMLKNLVMLNENIRRSHEVYEQLLSALADLSDYHETYMRASEIVIEKAEEGKTKFSVLDFARAMVEAAEEVMPSEDEPGEEDPLVESRR